LNSTESSLSTTATHSTPLLHHSKIKIAADHPTIELEVEDVYLAQAYAADIIASEEIFFAESA
jgi:hypothetical protein